MEANAWRLNYIDCNSRCFYVDIKCPLTLGGHKLRMFENRCILEIFGPKREEGKRLNVECKGSSSINYALQILV
jgi:hypothetical protein